MATHINTAQYVTSYFLPGSDQVAIMNKYRWWLEGEVRRIIGEEIRKTAG